VKESILNLSLPLNLSVEGEPPTIFFRHKRGKKRGKKGKREKKRKTKMAGLSFSPPPSFFFSR